MTTPPPRQREPGPAHGAAADLRAELAKARASKCPTRRGIMMCAQFLGQMLQLGWDKSALDALELVFWQVRDADGRVIQVRPAAAPTPAQDGGGKAVAG